MVKALVEMVKTTHGERGSQQQMCGKIFCAVMVKYVKNLELGNSAMHVLQDHAALFSRFRIFRSGRALSPLAIITPNHDVYHLIAWDEELVG